MSVWTHVAGVIRADGAYYKTNCDTLDDCDTDETPFSWDDAIGKECLWGSPRETWLDADANPDAYMPMGSEGSLHKLIWRNPADGCEYMHTITIFGDLRDYDEHKKIIEWFKEVCNKLYIRNAVITATNGYEEVTWTYDGE